MPDVDDLSEEEQVKVFWLQKHLYKNGIEGIHFTGRMRNYLREDGEDDIQDHVDSDLNGRHF